MSDPEVLHSAESDRVMREAIDALAELPRKAILRLRTAVEILYTAHKIVVFDTDEDRQRQQEVLASVVEILGYEPALIDGTSDA